MTKVPHQLQIHLDYDPVSFDLLVTYSYPYSTPHALAEQRMQIPPDDIPEVLKAELDAFVERMVARIPEVDLVRVPHAEIAPEVRLRWLTIVIQDRSRTDIPVARMYYLEVIEEMSSQVEREVRIEKQEFETSNDLMNTWKQIRGIAKGIAWRDYKLRFGRYFSS